MRKILQILIICSIVIAGLAVIASTGLVTARSSVITSNNANSEINSTQSSGINGTEAVNVGDPQESFVQSGKGSLVRTTYLPVNMTQTINLSKPTVNMTLYPIFERWDGLVRTENLQSLLVDENNNTIPRKGGISVTTILHSVNATCTEPYFVKVMNTGGFENGGIQLENTTVSVSSRIDWGGPDIAVFTKPQSGTLYYTTAGYGIVPADYNDNHDKFFENTGGAGNQETSGTYHLSFVSFFPANVNLPKQAELTSSLEVKCAIDEDPEKLEFQHIYVYNVWFKIE